MVANNNIPKHWQALKVSQIGNLIRGVNYKKEEATTIPTENYLPILRGNNINGILNFDDLVYVQQKNISEEQLVQKGDIVFAMSSGSKHLVGKSAKALSDLNVGFGAFCAVFRANEIVNKDFIAYFFQSPYYKKVISEISKGTNINNLKREHILDLDFPSPPLPEQLAIVSRIEELFSELDNGKQQLLAAQQQLKVYRQSLLKSAFEGKLTAAWREAQQQKENVVLALAAEPGATYHKNGELPDAWKEVTLGDVCKNVEYGSATKSKASGKVPVLRMGNIQNGRFDWEDLVFTDDDDEIQKYLLKKNDVLFNRTNSAELVGKTAIYKGERPAIFAGYLIRINRIETLIDADYLTYYLNSHLAKQYGNSVRSFGVNQSNINGTKLKTYPLPLPLLEEQHKIIEVLESKLTVCDKLDETIAQSLQQAETLRQSILKRAFEGELIS